MSRDEMPTAAPVAPVAAKVGVSQQRRAVGVGFSLLALPLLSLALLHAEPSFELSSVLLLFLTVTVIASAIGGMLVAIPTGIVAAALATFAFTEPRRTFVIDDLEVAIAIVVFAVVTALSSWLVDRAARQHRITARASAEVAALARLTTTLSSWEDPLPALVEDLARTFGLDAVAVLRREQGEWQVVASAGQLSDPEQATDTIPISDTHVLALTGQRLPVDERRVLTAYAGQLALALTTQQLEAAASQALIQAESDRLRAALLSSVSHDLRTPLAAIKASASSLLQDDVTWSPTDTAEFARSIVTESDRLEALITNLLDLSRLQADSVQLRPQAVGFDELVPAVLHTLPFRSAPIRVELSEQLPAVAADAVLLDRIITNLIDNAVRWSPTGATVLVRAGMDRPDQVRLDIIDRGPGIPSEAREKVFQPFQRLHDRSGDGHGVGLGLAVARGFARAMGGDLRLDHTPGGGTTASLHLPVAEVEPQP